MSEAVHDAARLAELQALPLDRKIQITQARIIEFHNWANGNIIVSVSGGKDSTVLADIVRKIYPETPLVFSNTGLEYPENQKIAKDMGAVFVRPSMRFDEVISTYGYPVISKSIANCIAGARIANTTIDRKYKYNLMQTSCGKYRRTALHDKLYTEDGKRSNYNCGKWLPVARDLPIPISHYCCDMMKKHPLKDYQREHECYPILGTMAEESRDRRNGWIKTGCNAFNGKQSKSQPMSFWTEQDVLQYIVDNNIKISSVYGDIVSVDAEGNQYPANSLIGGCGKLQCTGCQRTGCVFCGFGFHLEKGETRFQKLARTHPKQYEYCMAGGQWVDNPNYDPTAPKMDGDWQNWNPKKIWVPSKHGLGMKFVFDEFNSIYGKNFYRYE